MTEFSDRYFRDLPPRERPYDTPVTDQLVFCVFPNGVKSWVYLYQVDGRTRRRTMGLFPDMGYESALAALEPTRLIAALDARSRRPAPGNRPRLQVSLRDVIVALGTTALVLALLALVVP